MQFPIFIHKDPDSDYGITIPDVPGCFSGGETIGEAIGNAQEALALHFEALVVDGDPLPRGSSIETWQADSDYAGGLWTLVDIDITPYLAKAGS